MLCTMYIHMYMYMYIVHTCTCTCTKYYSRHRNSKVHKQHTGVPYIQITHLLLHPSPAASSTAAGQYCLPEILNAYKQDFYKLWEPLGMCMCIYCTIMHTCLWQCTCEGSITCPLTNTGSSLQSVDGVSLVDAGRVKVHARQLEPEPVRDYNILRRETLMENLERETSSPTHHDLHDIRYPSRTVTNDDCELITR